MSNWITGSAAVRYLAANYPFDDFPAAVAFVDQKLADGSLHWQSNPRIPSEILNEMRVEDGCPEHISYNCVEVRRADVQKLCPSPPKGKTGRRTKYKYEEALIHLAKLCINDAAYRNPSKEKLFSAMRQWFIDNDQDGGPEDRAVQERVDNFYDEVFDED